MDPLKQSTSPTPAPAYPALLRWLRGTWLWRQAGRLLHPRPQPAPPRPRAPLLSAEWLEGRNPTVPILSMAGGAMLGGTLAALVPPMATPAQVLMRGDWGPGQPSYDPQAPQRDAGLAKDV